MTTGTLYGMHGESGNQIVNLVLRAKQAGVKYAVVLAHENPGLCVDVKAIEPRTLTIARWKNPNDGWEGGQNAANWSATERQDFARQSIQLIFDRTNDTEYQASDLFCPGLNEWDPPEPGGWGRAALAWLALLDEADRRSPEMTSRGLHPIRLALPGCSQGTPEYGEMLDVKATGLFSRMQPCGDILLLHEGVFWDEPINKGFGDSIPGAPSVPPNAGSLCGRFNYWYSLGIQVRFVISEFYDGKRREAPNLERLARMQWYDRLVRKNPYCRGVCAFELTDDVNSAWRAVDYTPVFQSAEMLADMVAEKDKPNGVPPAPLQEIVLDISHYQPVTSDLATAKAGGAAGVIIRSNYGMAADTSAPDHIRHAEAAGLPRGFYWYHLSRQHAVDQAALAFRVAGSRPGLQGFVDLEESAGNDGAEPVFARYSNGYFLHVDTALRECDRLTGKTTGIYTRKSWLDFWFTLEQQRLWNSRPLWAASWGSGTPSLPVGWSVLPRPYVLHQFKVNESWPGFSGNVDQNKTYPGLRAVDIFGITAPAPPPTGALTMAQIEDITAALNDVDAAVARARAALTPKHRMATLTNQEVINLFAAVFGTASYFAVLTTAVGQIQANRMLAARTALYTGSPVEDMALSAADKTRLIAALS